jgi:SAM-dependent methyltransferase
MTGSGCRPLIRRLGLSSAAGISLEEGQLRGIQDFRKAVGRGVYSFSSNPCLCGAGRQDVLIARRDRYGLDVRTVLCPSCGLLRSDPYFDSEGAGIFYKNHYRSIYTGSNSAFTAFSEESARGREIIRFLAEEGVPFPQRVFEIGCGTGGILDVFRREGAQVWGCDLEEGFLEFGQKKGLSLKCGNAECLDNYAPADMVILCHALEHFRNPASELLKIKGLLAPNGVLYVEVPGLFRIEKAYGGDLGRYLQNAHVYHYSLESLDFVLSLAGFARQAGNQRVKAVFRHSDISPLRSDRLPEITLKYLRRLERRRQAYIWRKRMSFPGRCFYRFLVAIFFHALNKDLKFSSHKNPG